MGRRRRPVQQTTSTLYRGPDSLWHVRVTLGRRPDGTTQRKHLQRRTKAELREVVRDLERRRDAGTQVRTVDDLTLVDWLEHWLEVVLPMTARWETLLTDENQRRVHVMPAAGAWRFSELRPEHLEAHYRRPQTDGHSTHVIRAVHRVLRSAIDHPVRRHRLGTNPAPAPPSADSFHQVPRWQRHVAFLSRIRPTLREATLGKGRAAST